MKSQGERLNLGQFEQLMLLAIVRLGEHAYGVSVRDEIAAEAGRDLSLGMVYKAAWRLESKGLIESHLGAPTARRGGRRKRLYRMTPAGRETLRSSLDTLRRLSMGVEKALAKR